MSHWEDRGCLLIGLFFLWMGIVIGIPCLLFDVDEVLYCGIAGMTVAMTTALDAERADERRWKRDYPITFGHLCMVLTHALVGMLIVGFKDMEYEAMRILGQSLSYYMGLPIIFFFIENSIKNKAEKRFIETLSVGDIFEESGSREGLPHSYNVNLELVGKALWKIIEISGNEIKLEDVHYKGRVKKVTTKELKKYKREYGITWFRSPEYFEYLAKEIQERAKKEYYGEDEE